jgi:ABC-type nitrate/sulfonate/bicarbonate transport system ATPase subunit
MLKLEHISKTLHGKPVIRDFSLSMAQGDVVCLTGPSGTGKTTLIRIAAGLLASDAGKRTLGTENIACAFQDSPLVPWLTTLQNMHFVLSPRLHGTQRDEQARFWIEKFGLTNAIDKKPKEMSGGMRRRLSIACSFAGTPSLLFLDEPFAFLDEFWQDAVVDEIIRQNRQRKLTVLMVSHQPEPVRRLDARVVFLEPEKKTDQCP